jgi:hypothetical protein
MWKPNHLLSVLSDEWHFTWPSVAGILEVKGPGVYANGRTNLEKSAIEACTTKTYAIVLGQAPVVVIAEQEESIGDALSQLQGGDGEEGRQKEDAEGNTHETLLRG